MFGGFGVGGGVFGEDTGGFEEEVIEETDEAQQTRQADGPGGEVGIEPFEDAAQHEFDGERGQGNQDGGRVKPNLPGHFKPSMHIGRRALLAS